MEKIQSQIHTPDYSKDESIGEITDENIDKVITPEHKESVRRLRELLDD